MNERKRQFRRIILDLVFGLKKATYPANSISSIRTAVAEILHRESGKQEDSLNILPFAKPLTPQDAELCDEIVWDLLIERVITPGLDHNNPGLDWIRLHSGARSKGRQSYE